MMHELQNKKVLVIGLGRSGVAAARFAASKGAHVTISEKKDKTAVMSFAEELDGLPVNLSFGKNDVSLMRGADLIILSPGVPTSIEGLNEAKKRSIPIIGELELAVSEIKTPIIAVTGTNGKTTTASLINHLLSSCGVKTSLGGNIGTALTGLIDDANKARFVVAEVSSYQLETTPSLKPWVAVLLNITDDHLDRHISFEEYADLKGRIFENIGGFGIYNAADKVVREIAKRSSAALIPFDVSKPHKHAVSKEKLGGWYENGRLWTKLSGETVNRFSLADVCLQGSHNLENMMAAVMVACLCGAPVAGIERALGTFQGLPHRISLVAEFKGVEYYDDSKGTNVGATAAAIKNFSKPLILIAGGQDKGGSYAPLQALIKGKVKLLILLGEARDKMVGELGGLTKTMLADTMDEAVKIAADEAVKGDVVLLSPACASFDMFRDYAERGDVFANMVKKWNR